ncbi:MAG: hypothetical protein ACQCN5_01100 [Candidatus Bathyarchaeia archaeon]
MRLVFKKYLTIALVISLFALITADVSSAYSSEPSTLDQSTVFLSSVVGLDMTKYSLIRPSPPSGNESLTSPNSSVNSSLEVDGLIEIKAPSYRFESNEGILNTMGTFYNGHLTFFNINSQGNYTYSDLPPTDLLNHVRTFLQKYEIFLAETSGSDITIIKPVQNILNDVKDLLPTSVTIGNITFRMSIDEGNTRLQWIYTENGIVMDRKRLDISFRNNALVSFRDTLTLYKVGGPSLISSEEATRIALEAAQKVELRIGHGDGTIETVKVPNLASAPYDVSFTMLPYRGIGNITSTLSRDPLTLFPYWQFHFYFNEEIGGCIGVQVGVWGDTKEIAYSSGYGVLGVQDLSDDKVLEEQKQPSSLESSVIMVIIIAVILSMSLPVIALRLRGQQKR